MKNIINKILKPFGYSMIKASTDEKGHWSNVIVGSFPNTAIEKVNNQTALTVSTVYACMRNVSEDIGKLPLKVYRREGDNRVEQQQHPLARILQSQPNPEMTAINFRETINANTMGWGNGYAEIQRDITGKPIYLWPLKSSCVTMYRQQGTNRIFYRVTTKDGKSSDIWGEDILHLHGLGFDGVSGYNLVQYMAEGIGAARGTDKFAGTFFSNGLRSSGSVTHKGNITQPAQDRLKKQLEGDFGGADKSHKVLILEEGMEFKENSLDPKASQMIETRQFTVEEFCRWLRVPPHKVANLKRSTFNNIEEQNIDYVTDGLLGWCVRWEQALWWKLLTESEKQQGYYLQHKVDGLLRGNIKGRFEAYSKMLNYGVFSINEIRGFEELNPVEGGNVHLVPMNFVPLQDAGKKQKGTTGNQQNAVVGTTKSMIDDLAGRLASREIKELEKHAKHADQDINRFKKWLNGFYNKHDAYIFKAVEPLLKGITVHVNLLSLKQLMQITNIPAATLEDRKDLHAAYIAKNLRRHYDKDFER